VLPSEPTLVAKEQRRIERLGGRMTRERRMGAGRGTTFL